MNSAPSPGLAAAHLQVAQHLFGARDAVRELLAIDGSGPALAALLAGDASTRHWRVDAVDGLETVLALPAERVRRCDAVCCFDGLPAADEAAARAALRHVLASLGPGGRFAWSVPLAADGIRFAASFASLLALMPLMSMVDAEARHATVVLSRRSLPHVDRLEAASSTGDARAGVQAAGHAADGVLYLHDGTVEPRLASRPAALEAEVEAALAAGHEDAALAAMLVGVHHHHARPEVAHRALYYPGLDRQLERLAARLAAQCPDPWPEASPRTGHTLVVATELYRVGGHSKVLEDVVREVTAPVVVLTEAFHGYREEAADHRWVHDALDPATVIVLPPQSLWSKCRALHRLTQRLRPARIVYFNHHQDPIPFVGTLANAGSTKIFAHHADHHPSLGVTLPGVVHLDMTDELATVCEGELGSPAATLPLYVPDQGRRAVEPVPPPAEWSVATSGTTAKFARSGDLALQRIAAAVLGATRGRFFHVGPMPADWLAEIRGELARLDIDPARFVSVGPVASLWQTLAALPVQLYVGSAPVGEARAAVEVQGSGLPLAHFRPADRGSLVALESIYASSALGWSAPSELPAVMATLAREGHSRFSDAARAHYERRFSRQRFREVLAGAGVV